MLLRRDMEPRRAETVWDIIALHTTGSIAACKSAETAMANRGISIDAVGLGSQSGLSAADPDLRAILDAFPRANFPDALGAALVDEVRANPAGSRFSFMESIAARHLDGYVRADFLDLIDKSRAFD
ncbi:MAG: hypothetical protein ABI894_02205 [Ilumatobacteraceae bacterium]